MAESEMEESEEYEDLPESEESTSLVHVDDDLHRVHSRFDESVLCKSPEVESFLKKAFIKEKAIDDAKKESAQNKKLVSLFNAIKNRRRLKILQILSTNPHDLEELRADLKDEGWYHSLNTVAKYIEPLVEAGLVRTTNNRYTLTSLGKDIQDISSGHGLEAFSPHSNCYEELCIQALRSGRKTYQELTVILEPSTLQRVLKRLGKAELIVRKHSSDHVFFAIHGKPDGKLSPTERRILNAIKANRSSGVPARELSKLVGINLRRTYKYLSRLKQKKRIAQWRKSVSYELTKRGESIATCLEEIVNSRPEFSRRPSIEFGFDTYGAIKNDALMAIRLSGDKGVLQSHLWKKLGWDGREGSRQVRRLEKKGLINRRRELRAGKWTYRIFPLHKFSSIDSIIEIPCSGCDDDLSGKCPNNTLTPDNCQKLTKWLTDSNNSDSNDSTSQRILS